MANGQSKEIRTICRIAKNQGWEVGMTKKCHVKLIPPGGGTPIISALTPSDWRGIKNLISRLRKHGFVYHE